MQRPDVEASEPDVERVSGRLHKSSLTATTPTVCPSHPSDLYPSSFLHEDLLPKRFHSPRGVRELRSTPSVTSPVLEPGAEVSEPGIERASRSPSQVVSHYNNTYRPCILSIPSLCFIPVLFSSRRLVAQASLVSPRSARAPVAIIL